MLLSLLYDNDQIIAAAPACEQQPYGQLFWFDQFGSDVDLTACETAVVQIDETELIERLLNIRIEATFLDGHDAARAVDGYLSQPSQPRIERIAA